MTVPSKAARLPGQSPLILAVPLLLSVIVAFASYAASGVTLGLFFGPVLLAPIVVPPLALSVSSQLLRLAVCIIYVGASCAVWVLAGQFEPNVIGRCGIVLAAFTLVLAYIPPALVRIRFHPILAAAIVTILGLAWLTWPVWLARELGEWMLRCAGPVNPLFAVNGAVRGYFDDWDRHQIAYQQLTTLNQDVMYSLPRSIWPSAVTHLLIALGGCVLAAIYRTKSTAKFPRD